MKKQFTILASCLAICLVGPLLFFAFWIAAAAGSSKGSVPLADEWRREFAQYQSPNEATRQNVRIVELQFESGEWAFGRAASSHGIWVRGGGTLVVKDSKGDVRAFFGHVCGDGHLQSYSSITHSLTEF